jgi:rhodanese-related sulfurtransferase
MGWSLAGIVCDSGANRKAGAISAATLEWAQKAARRVARMCGVEQIDLRTLEVLRADKNRTLYLFDVRDPAEYAAGHLPGAISAPGGQLVQATDQYVGALGARIVLVDDAQVRALMTASWLKQMGWPEVFALAAAGAETGWPTTPMLKSPASAVQTIALVDFAERFAHNAATLVDLSLSRDYAKGHIPGAWFAIRTRLERALERIPLRDLLVLTSEDGIVAALAGAEADSLVEVPVRILSGGNAAWRAAGYEFSAEPLMADEAVDQWRKPYERAGDVKAFMSEYLAWETGLLPRVERDGSLNFAPLGGRVPQSA